MSGENGVRPLTDLEAENRRLKERLSRMADRNAQMETLQMLYSEILKTSGLDNLVGRIIELIMNLYGGRCITLFYRIRDEWRSMDSFGRKSTLNPAQDDPELMKVIQSRKKSQACDGQATQVLGPAAHQFTTHNCQFPIEVNQTVTGVIRIEGIVVYQDEIAHELEVFFHYMGLALTNEISNQSQIDDLNQALQQKITQISAELADKEILLKEIHHRVKNNLQVISSLLNLQARSLKNTDAGKYLRDTAQRVRSMGIIHETLYQSENFARINFNLYLKKITSEISRLYNFQERGIIVATILDDVVLPLDLAIPCGLITNELLTNAAKYAYPEGQKGQIEVKVTRQEQKISLTVCDHGVGKCIDNAVKPGSMGTMLIETLTEQLNGKLITRNTSGTCVTVTFQSID